MGRQVGTKLRGNSIYPDSRSQSEVVAVVLILGLVLLGAFVIVGLGVGAIGGTESQLSDDRAEKVLTQLDSKASLVALDRADSQEIAFPSDGGDAFSVDEDAGWLKIEIVNRTSGDTVEWTEEDGLVNVSLGALVYENGDTRMAYQGGGVFRSGGERGMMVSPPEFHYRDGTLTLPIVNVTGNQLSGNGARISHSAENRAFPLVDQPNPLDDHEVVVTVQSEFYEGWGHYFEERTDGEVGYDDEENTAEITLVTPIGEETVDVAIRSDSPGGEFSVSGTAGDPCGPGGGGDVYLDSYNSSETSDGYCDQTPGSSGNITYGGDVDLSSGSGSSDVEGTIESGGHVSLSSGGGQPAVIGDVFHTDGCDVATGPGGPCEDEVSGDVESISGISPSPDIENVIENKVSDLSDGNNNDDGDISNNRLEFDSGTATLEQGSYYLDKIDFSGGNQLELDTEDGDIIIGIEEYIDVDSNEITISGGNDVEIYVNSSEKINDYEMLRIHGGEVLIENDNSPELSVFGKADANVTVNDGSFTGVIYAPPGNSGSGKLTVSETGSGAHIFGAAVIADTKVDNQGSIHFDEALKDHTILAEDTNIITITYLHVTENTIRID